MLVHLCMFQLWYLIFNVIPKTSVYIFHIQKYVFVHAHVLRFIHRANSYIHEHAFVIDNEETAVICNAWHAFWGTAWSWEIVGEPWCVLKYARVLMCVWNELISASFSRAKTAGVAFSHYCFSAWSVQLLASEALLFLWHCFLFGSLSLEKHELPQAGYHSCQMQCSFFICLGMLHFTWQHSYTDIYALIKVWAVWRHVMNSRC